MRYFIYVFFFVLSISASAQVFPSQQWRAGIAVLTNGDSIKGSIKYNLETNVIQIERKKKVATFNAGQVSYFKVKPSKFRPERTFYSVPYRNKTGYLSPRFYELMSEGETTLLGREYIAIITNTSNPNFIRPMNSSFARLASSTPNAMKYMAYKLFLLNNKGEIVPVGETLNRTLNAFGNNKPELRKFIKEQQMNLLNVVDFVRLVEYYNRISS